MTISRQTIKNFLKINNKQVIKKGNRTNQKISKLSGYLVIYEQFINLPEKRHYGVTLHDQWIKNPIAEEIMESRTKKNIISLIKETTKVEKIIPSFNRLTEYMRDNSILRTTN